MGTPNTGPTSIQGWMSPPELLFLEQAGRGRTIVEFGSWVGRSTKALAAEAQRLVACDWWEGDHHSNGIHDRMLREGLDVEAEFRKNLAEEIEEDRVRPLTVDLRSPQAFEDIWNRLGHHSPSMVFIDANHCAPHPALDIELALALVGTSGVVCGHDYDPRGWPDVVKAVNQAFHTVRRGPDSIWWALAADRRA